MKALSKLEEAFYYFHLMKENVDNKDNFKFNLSAFLSSARSITFFLQKEFKGNPRFEEWYPHKRDEMKKNKLMKFCKEMRDNEIHVKRVDVEGHHKVSLTDTVSLRTNIAFISGLYFDCSDKYEEMGLR